LEFGEIELIENPEQDGDDPSYENLRKMRKAMAQWTGSRSELAGSRHSAVAEPPSPQASG
jgi:hypothetical protein